VIEIDHLLEISITTCLGDAPNSKDIERGAVGGKV